MVHPQRTVPVGFGVELWWVFPGSGEGWKKMVLNRRDL